MPQNTMASTHQDVNKQSSGPAVRRKCSYSTGTYFGSKSTFTAHKPQPRSPSAPQFKLLPAGVPSIQAHSRFTDVTALDCDAPTQKLSTGTLRENAYRPLFLDVPAIVSRCEFIGQAVININQLDASVSSVPLSFKHDFPPRLVTYQLEVCW
jgi:hypothetical protein